MSWQSRSTLKDIAKHTDLSVAAVSMALRDHASLPAATIARVKHAARELNYTPDPAASALAAHTGMAKRGERSGHMAQARITQRTG